MKKMTFLATLLLVAVQALAGNVDLATAKQKAAAFMGSNAVKGRMMSSAPTVKWVHEVKNSSNALQAAYYIVNTNSGYVIVAGDDRAKDILAYGDYPLTDLNDIPDNMQFFLNLFKAELEYLQAHPGLMVEKRVNRGGVSIEPMLTTEWGQGKPYNMRCPRVGRDYCMVGCTANALAQVMKYWEYPAKSAAMPGYTCPESGIQVPALPEYTFDWDNMWDSYAAYSNNTDQLPEVNKDAIAYLMRYVGQAETIDYNVLRSGTDNFKILNAIRFFEYDEGAYIAKKYDSPDFTGDTAHDGHEFYNDEEWGELIQSELRAGRPLVYCANDMSSDSLSIGGHAFNIDGYDANNDMYHVNFGMRAELNAYYALNAFRIDDFTVYDFWPILFAGVQPPGISTDPRILTSTRDLAIEAYAGDTGTATFDVSGDYLTGNISVTLNDTNGVFTIDATTVALDELGKTITVTFAPQTAGIHNATITLSSDGATDVVVNLKGIATNAPLEVYNPVMLPADSAYINLTSFRADWTDQTADDNVASYTLEVNQKPASGGMLAEVDWSTGSGDAEAYLPEGWTVGDYSIFFDEGGIAITGGSYIRTNTYDLTGVNKVTVVFTAKNYYYWSWQAASITVMSSLDSETFTLTSNYDEYTVVLDCADQDQITFYSVENNPTIQTIKIYLGEVTAPQLRAVVEDGNATKRVVTGITDKHYTVENLEAGGTFLYKVRAIYTDGTESDWSNIEMVTLFENGHGFEKGDLNHDGVVNVTDVTLLIAAVLNNSDNVCAICADMNEDGQINVTDVTMLISKVLASV